MEDLQRKLPFALEAEQSVLGSVLINPECITEITGIISEEDFYLEEHRSIFAAMRQLFVKSREIDVVTLIRMLEEEGIYDKSGGTQYIKLIAEVVPTAQNAKDYAKIVKDKSTLRRLILACDDISENAYSEQGAVDSLLGNAEQKIFELAQNRDTKQFRHIHDVLVKVYDDLELLVTDKEAAHGTPTGFSGLDSVLVGMGKGDMIIVGARPGMGKTSFTMNIATNVARQTGKKVCVFSLEMSAEQLASRMLSSEAMVDSYALRSGKIEDEDWQKLAHAVTELSGTEIYIDDSTGLTITQMKSKLRRMKNLGLVIIDYLQLMQSDKKTDNRTAEVGDISRNLKIMGKELGVPIICCAQLSRNPESRAGAGGKRPMISDLRESGSIEQDADVIIFLYRDDYYALDKPEESEQNIVEVIVAKNRHGATKTVKMGWIPQYTKFRTIDNDREEM